MAELGAAFVVVVALAIVTVAIALAIKRLPRHLPPRGEEDR